MEWKQGHRRQRDKERTMTSDGTGDLGPFISRAQLLFILTLNETLISLYIIPPNHFFCCCCHI